MTASQTVSDPSPASADVTATVAPVRHRALVIASRTFLVMLLVAALAVLGLGVFAYLRGGDEVEVSGWLRTIFGTVFLVVGIGLAAFLGIPSVIGLWALSGANKVDAIPAMSLPIRVALGGIAAATVAITAIVLVTTGSAVSIVNLGLLLIVAFGSVGLAGAVAFTPRRPRAILAAVALSSFLVATAWILVNAFVSPPV